MHIFLFYVQFLSYFGSYLSILFVELKDVSDSYIKKKYFLFISY